jgi:hypothetical protein
MWTLRFLLPVFFVLSAAVCGAQPVADAEAHRLGGGESWRTDFSIHSVPLDEIVSGGPPKDGIPALDRPLFETVREADRWLSDREPVMVVEYGGEVKAYPLSILIWHEIVNDDVGGRPLAVTFCPLCNTAIVLERRIDEHLLDFGTTGRLRHSDLVMYDRQTETWWQQATGEGIVGALTGTRLEMVPQSTMAWRTVRELHPGARVLSRRTGYDRPYGRNPYSRYDDRANSPIRAFFRRDSDPRLPAMERVVAIEVGNGWAASFSDLGIERVVNASVDGFPFLVVWQPGAASALDTEAIAEGREVGETAAFDRRLDGRPLTFRQSGDGLRDLETDSRWDFAGRAVSGPLQGRRLRAIPHANHFWFAWIAFRPGTQLWSP